MLNDWLAHTPKSVLAKNLGVSESVLEEIPGGNVFGLPPTNISTALVPDPNGQLEGNSSYVYHLSQKPPAEVPGRGGTLAIVDSRNFPVAKNIASAVVTLEPNGLRELHWHPNVGVLLSHIFRVFEYPKTLLKSSREPNGYFSFMVKAVQRCSLGVAMPERLISAPVTLVSSRTLPVHLFLSAFLLFSKSNLTLFAYTDACVSGHYIENTSDTDNLTWVEVFKSDHWADVSLTQWLALTPPDLVATALNVPVQVVENLKKEKQYIVKGD